ncbi:MAG: sialate O-acetylesterase [Saprospiraceae bacterium]
MSRLICLLNRLEPPGLITLLCLLLWMPPSSFGQLRLAKVFQDHMVLQRGHEITIWGTSNKKDRVSITFNGQTVTTRADKLGNWTYLLPAMEAGGPHLLRVSSRKEVRLISDILIGDLWICSGQSNMEWIVRNSNNAAEEMANAKDDQIRQFKVPHTWASEPQDTLVSGEWRIANPENVGDFSAVGYFFARELRQHVDVPIGLINTSWGGSKIEPWMHASSLEGYPIPKVDSLIQAATEESKKKLQSLEARLGQLPEKDNGLEKGWHQANFLDSDWLTINLPGLWETAGYEGLNGVFWFRKTIELTEAEAAAGIQLSLGKIDDSDWTYVNGQEVGSNIDAYAKDRVYEVSASVLKAGQNTIAVRVEDTGGGGGIYGDAAQLFYQSNQGKTSLATSWKMKIGAASYESGGAFQINQTPTILYNIMIHPLLKLPIKGALWYQGESNADEEGAYVYRDLFARMITDWRARWGVGDFPFLYVQLANFMAPSPTPTESNWAVLRESQSATLAIPNTAQVVIIDIGEAKDIHPRNKQDVGLRLSLAARKLAYQQDVVYSGPVYKEMKIEGNKVVLSFDHVGSGLVAHDKYGYLKGFTIAGADKQFVWAKAEIKGNQIIVWSDEVKAPVAVRYGWANNPDDVNLYNKEGLPASPFRTDK